MFQSLRELLRRGIHQHLLDKRQRPNLLRECVIKVNSHQYHLQRSSYALERFHPHRDSWRLRGGVGDPPRRWCCRPAKNLQVKQTHEFPRHREYHLRRWFREQILVVEEHNHLPRIREHRERAVYQHQSTCERSIRLRSCFKQTP